MRLDPADALLAPGHLPLESGTLRLHEDIGYGCEMRSRFWLGETDPAALAGTRESRIPP